MPSKAKEEALKRRNTKKKKKHREGRHTRKIRQLMKKVGHLQKLEALLVVPVEMIGSNCQSIFHMLLHSGSLHDSQQLRVLLFSHTPMEPPGVLVGQQGGRLATAES